jgi:hypothetical protein
MAMVQIECRETDELVDIVELRPNSPMHADHFSRQNTCPYCGKSHTWTSGMRGLAYQVLNAAAMSSTAND